ncbi:MAG: hypothetical protein AB4040_06290 [Synechococcus sp.]
MHSSSRAPHTLEEKSKPYPHSPSGVPGVETSLPLMLTARDGEIDDTVRGKPLHFAPYPDPQKVTS